MVAGHEFARHLLLYRTASSAIAITDPGDHYPTFNDIRSYAIEHLCLEFFDIQYTSETHRGPQHEDIEAAIDWYDKYRKSFRWERGNVVVSCTAGQSRSAALAFVVGCSLRTPEEAAKVWNPRFHYPSMRIVSIGAEVLGKTEMVEVATEFWEERARRRHLKGKPPKTDVCP